MHLWLLLLAVGTFLCFPRLAKALVALGLLGCLVVAGIVGYQILDRQLQEDRDRQRYAQECHAFFAAPAPAGEPTVEELHRAVYGPDCGKLFGVHGERLPTSPALAERRH